MILAFLCYNNLRRETGGLELASTITLVLQADRLTKCYNNLRRETGGFEIASTITLVLQADRLTKCASHPEEITIKQLNS